MPCSICRTPGDDPCSGCLAALVPSPAHLLGPVVVHPRFRHEGGARALVHRLKYSGVAPRWLGPVLASVLPRGCTALVPVPRVAVRRWRYGVDPAETLARLVSMASGLPVRRALRAPPWVRRRAGPGGVVRGDPRFVATGGAPRGAVLIDDVVTTGTTLRAASDACGLTVAVTLTSAVR